MSSEIEALRAQLVQCEQQRLRFAARVHQAAQGLVGTCQTGMMEHAQLEAEQLVTLAAQEQHLLQRGTR